MRGRLGVLVVVVAASALAGAACGGKTQCGGSQTYCDRSQGLVCCLGYGDAGLGSTCVRGAAACPELTQCPDTDPEGPGSAGGLCPAQYWCLWDGNTITGCSATCLHPLRHCGSFPACCTVGSYCSLDSSPYQPARCVAPGQDDAAVPQQDVGPCDAESAEGPPDAAPADGPADAGQD